MPAALCAQCLARPACGSLDWLCPTCWLEGLNHRHHEASHAHGALQQPNGQFVSAHPAHIHAVGELSGSLAGHFTSETTEETLPMPSLTVDVQVDLTQSNAQMERMSLGFEELERAMARSYLVHGNASVEVMRRALRQFTGNHQELTRVPEKARVSAAPLARARALAFGDIPC